MLVGTTNSFHLIAPISMKSTCEDLDYKECMGNYVNYLLFWV